jgi:hypothetical protein
MEQLMRLFWFIFVHHEDLYIGKDYVNVCTFGYINIEIWEITLAPPQKVLLVCLSEEVTTWQTFEYNFVVKRP